MGQENQFIQFDYFWKIINDLKKQITQGDVASVTGNIVDNTDPNNPIVTQVQSDWSEADNTQPDYIKNKPAFADGEVTGNNHAALVILANAGQLVPSRSYYQTDGADLGIKMWADTPSVFKQKATAGFYAADWTSTGDYTGVFAQTGIAAGSPLGLWQGTKGSFNYDNGVGTPFAAGDVITSISGWTATVVTDNGTKITYNLLNGTTPANNDLFDNGIISAQVDGANTFTFQYALGDFAIAFNGTRWVNYQHIIAGDTNTNPASDAVNWAELTTSTTKGYTEQWREVEYDFVNNSILENRDLLGNVIYGQYLKFPFGNPNFTNVNWYMKNFTLSKPAFIMTNVNIGAGGNFTVNEFDGDITNSDFAPFVTITGMAGMDKLTVGAGASLDGVGLYHWNSGTIDAGQSLTLTKNHDNESYFNPPPNQV